LNTTEVMHHMNQVAPAPTVLDSDEVAAAAEKPTVPGFKGMWVAVCLEYLEFAVFFSVYFVNPQAFQEGAARLWTLGGVCVTLVMVTSGYALTQALDAHRHHDVRRALQWQLAALVIGLCYPVLKLLEWQWNQAHGIDAGSGIFVVVYYYLTINHFVHACWGLGGMVWCLARARAGAYSGGDVRGLESLATYWHATDLVWLMIFALFYAFA
jgi:cytochrome c oxidase subunit 3